MAKFRIWIAVDIEEGNFETSKDAEDKCISFFNAFKNQYFPSEEFIQMGVGTNNIKKTRDVVFEKYFNDDKTASDYAKNLRNILTNFKDNIILENNQAYIEREYFKNCIKNLEDDLYAFSIIKTINFS